MAPKKKTATKEVASKTGSGASSAQGAAATSCSTAEGSFAAQGFAVGWRVTRRNARDCGIQLLDGLTEEQLKKQNAPRVEIESTGGSGNEEDEDSHDDCASEPSEEDVASAAPAKRVTRSNARDRGIQLLEGLTEEQCKKKKVPRAAIESTGGSGIEEDEDSHGDSASEPFQEDVASAAPAKRVTRSNARDRGIQLLDGLTEEQCKKKKAPRAAIASTGGSGKEEDEDSHDDSANEPFGEGVASAMDDHEKDKLRGGPIRPASPTKESSSCGKGKFIATSEDSAKNKPRRASGYTIIMEACKQTYEFQKAAKDLRCELRTAFPSISMSMVDKPRKRCFEVRSKSGEIFLQHLNLKEPYTELETIDAARVIEDIGKKFS